MKKISEMTEDEVRDYALSLEQQQQTYEEDKKKLQDEITELHGLNRTLQRRNNDLFLQVEQQTTGDPVKDPEPEEKIVSCEDFTKNLIKEGKL